MAQRHQAKQSVAKSPIQSRALTIAGIFMSIVGRILSSWVFNEIVQFKMVSKRSEEPICAPPRLSELSPTVSLKQFRCLFDWRLPTLVLSRKTVWLKWMHCAFKSNVIHKESTMATYVTGGKTQNRNNPHANRQMDSSILDLFLFPNF